MSAENNKLIIADIEITDVCELGKIWDKFDFERDFVKLVNFCQTKCPEKANLLVKNKQFFIKNGNDSLKSLFCPPANAKYFFLKEYTEILKNQFSCSLLHVPKAENPFLNKISGVICIEDDFFVYSLEKCWKLQNEQFDDGKVDVETAKILKQSKGSFFIHNKPIFWIDGELKARRNNKWVTLASRDVLPPIVESVYWENETCCVLGRNPDGNLLLTRCGSNEYLEFDKDLNVLQAAYFNDETILIAKARNCDDYIVLTNTKEKNIFQKQFISSKKIKIYPLPEIIFLAFSDKSMFCYSGNGLKWQDTNVVLDYITFMNNQYVGIKDNMIYSSVRGEYWVAKGCIPRENFHPIYFACNKKQIICSSEKPYEICKITLSREQ